MMLSEFDISFILQKAIKGKAIANFLANCLVDECMSFGLDFSDDHILYIEV